MYNERVDRLCAPFALPQFVECAALVKASWPKGHSALLEWAQSALAAHESAVFSAIDRELRTCNLKLVVISGAEAAEHASAAGIDASSFYPALCMNNVYETTSIITDVDNSSGGGRELVLPRQATDG